jgi:N-acetylmuramic acid 6-phosphate etherase
MVDLHASNRKLVDRATRIVCLLTGIAEEDAQALLERCGGELKTAIVCERLQYQPPAARAKLVDVGGRLRDALDEDQC